MGHSLGYNRKKRERMSKLNQQNATWNLQDIYASDTEWETELKALPSLIDRLASRKGCAAASAAGLLETAKLYEQCMISLSRLYLYAACKYHPDMSDDAAKSMCERVMTEYNRFGEKTAFLAPELMQESLEKFESFVKEQPELAVYRHFAEDFFSKKEHVLDQKGEEMLVRMQDMGQSFEKIYEDLTVNDMAFPEVEGPDGKPVQVSDSGLGAALNSQDRRYRRDYFEGLLGTYGKHIRTIASNYAGSVKSDVYAAKSRNYRTAREAALAENHVPEEVYDNLIQTLRSNTGPLQEYVSLRKQLLGVDKIHHYDFFVPIVKDTEKAYPYQEGKEIVLEATAVLGEDYNEVMRHAVDDRWIDIYPGKNKRSGAYSTGAPGVHPYMLLNYTDTLDDVFTLAHELGHSMHTYYSQKEQPFIYSDYSIFCAEVASTTNEMLLFHDLLQKAQTDEEKALLLSKHLDDIRSTVFRQTIFADFEYQAHKLTEEGKPLLPSTLCEIYRGLVADYYGPDFEADDIISYEWARIPHFYNAYYVYQYSTGLAAAVAISRRIRELGQPAVDDYRKFLASGSSAHPIELLKIAGVDMASPQPVLDTVADFAETLAELKKVLHI